MHVAIADKNNGWKINVFEAQLKERKEKKTTKSFVRPRGFRDSRRKLGQRSVFVHAMVSQLDFTGGKYRQHFGQ